MTEEIKEVINKINKRVKGIERDVEHQRLIITWAITRLEGSNIKSYIKDIKSNLDRLMKIDEQLSREEEE